MKKGTLLKNLCLWLLLFSTTAFGKNEHDLPNSLDECPDIVGKFEQMTGSGKEIWEITRGVEPELDRLNPAVPFFKVAYSNNNPPPGHLNYYFYYLDKSIYHYSSSRDSEYTYSHLALCDNQKLHYVGLKIRNSREVYWISTRSFYLDSAGNLIQEYSHENQEKNWQETLIKLR